MREKRIRSEEVGDRITGYVLILRMSEAVKGLKSERETDGQLSAFYSISVAKPVGHDNNVPAAVLAVLLRREKRVADSHCEGFVATLKLGEKEACRASMRDINSNVQWL